MENALKVNPVLGPQVFQPLLPSIFRGIIDGEVRVTLKLLSAVPLEQERTFSYQLQFYHTDVAFSVILIAPDRSLTAILEVCRSNIVVQESKQHIHHLFCHLVFILIECYSILHSLLTLKRCYDSTLRFFEGVGVFCCFF